MPQDPSDLTGDHRSSLAIVERHRFLPSSCLTIDDPFSVGVVPRDRAWCLPGASPVLTGNTLLLASRHLAIDERVTVPSRT
jgi:hypothetical protein